MAWVTDKNGKKINMKFQTLAVHSMADIFPHGSSTKKFLIKKKGITGKVREQYGGRHNSSVATTIFGDFMMMAIKRCIDTRERFILPSTTGACINVKWLPQRTTTNIIRKAKDKTLYQKSKWRIPNLMLDFGTSKKNDYIVHVPKHLLEEMQYNASEGMEYNCYLGKGFTYKDVIDKLYDKYDKFEPEGLERMVRFFLKKMLHFCRYNLCLKIYYAKDKTIKIYKYVHPDKITRENIRQLRKDEIKRMEDAEQRNSSE